MAEAKKGKGAKMSLNEFLANDEFGSWADDVADLPTAPSFSSAGSREPSRPIGYGAGAPPRGPGGYDGGRRDDREMGGAFERRDRREPAPRRGPSIPIPDEPPFTAFIGNLSFEVNEEDIADLFFNSPIVQIRLLRDRDGRPKGFGYVEFESAQALESALGKDGESLKGRGIRIDVAEQQRESSRPPRGDDKTTGDWRSARPVRQVSPPRRAPPRDYENGRSEGRFGGSEGRFGGAPRRAPEPSGPPAERPKLNLLPRSAPASGEPSPTTADEAEKAAKANPFGAARPVDTREMERKAEEKLRQKQEEERKRVEAAKAAKEEKEKDAAKPASPVKKEASEEKKDAAPAKPKSNPFGAAKPIDTREIEKRVEEKLRIKEEEIKKEVEADGEKEGEKKPAAATDGAAAKDRAPSQYNRPRSDSSHSRRGTGSSAFSSRGSNRGGRGGSRGGAAAAAPSRGGFVPARGSGRNNNRGDRPFGAKKEEVEEKIQTKNVFDLLGEDQE